MKITEREKALEKYNKILEREEAFHNLDKALKELFATERADLIKYIIEPLNNYLKNRKAKKMQGKQ